MGAAWRGLEGRERGFERILSMVREVRGMGMEGQFCARVWEGGGRGGRVFREFVADEDHFSDNLSFLRTWTVNL